MEPNQQTPQPPTPQPTQTVETPSPPSQSPANPLQKPQKNNLLIVGISLAVSIVLGVSGYFAYQYFQLKNQLTQTSPSPLPSEAETSMKQDDPTANWQTYTYPLFSLKTPKEFTEYSSTNPIQLINYDSQNEAGGEFDPTQDEGKLKVEIYTNTTSSTLQDYLAQQKAIDTQGPEINWQETPMSINDQKAIRVDTTNPGFFIVVKHPARSSIISISFALDFDNFENLANLILSTFQFLEENNSGIQVNAPLPSSTISSPVTIKGQASNLWFFEGSFPVKLLDLSRNEIASSFVSEVNPGSWMNEGMIGFRGTLEFTTTATSGFLVFQADNPSGLPENNKSFELPITFAN